MTTLSIPISSRQEEFILSLVRRKVASNKADAVRRAIDLFAEGEAVSSVLRAEQELLEGRILRGDPRKLLKKFQYD